MPDRRPYVAGNWKMNTDRSGALELARAVAQGASSHQAVDVAVFPPFVWLDPVIRDLCEQSLALPVGAQDAWHEPDGAFTGEVSLQMLRGLGAKLVLTGHSERRHVIGESDRLVGLKTRAALDAGFTTFLCIGETLEQREAGETDDVNRRQLTAGLEGVPADRLGDLVIAYEPVWAIGTGRTASPEDAQAAHHAVRETLASLYDKGVADATRILYGGSMKPANAADLLAQPDVDGGLIGGASLKPDDFLAIVDAAG